MSEILKIAVVSDLHCGLSSISNGSTRLFSDQARKPIEKHPVSALKKLIKEKSLSVDIVLCPGDITDKSSNQGFLSGWDYLKGIREAFNAKNLFATIGNHDVKSRGEESQPFEFAKDLDEDYPLGNNSYNTDFWANSFAIIENDLAIYLIFNSSYSHKNENTASKSNINQSILDAMKNKLLPYTGSTKIKIAMCHHHPINHYNNSSPDIDIMDKGDLFVKLLNDFGFYMLIHGHKHEPRLSVLNDLPILASGSFSALGNIADTCSENMFHIITIKKGIKKGVITSYIYRPDGGWIIVADTKFPCLTGFGFLGDVDQYASLCANWMNNQSKNFIPYYEILEELPELQYLTPSKQIQLNEKMKEFTYEFVPALYNQPKYLIKQHE